MIRLSVEQDTHLETLTGSIRRQREISENIGNELDVHTGLLEDLESGLDDTALRLGGARRRLETVGRGARDNCGCLRSCYRLRFDAVRLDTSHWDAVN